jgi:hypothetical protein
MLYLVSNHDLLSFLVREFYDCNRAVHFGLRSDFLSETLSLPAEQSLTPLDHVSLHADGSLGWAEEQS